MLKEREPQIRKNEITILTSSLFDPRLRAFLSDISIVVDTDTGLVIRTYKQDDSLPPPDPAVEVNTIDLRGLTVLPGLVDAHTHIFLHPYSETPSLNQMRDESFVERVVRATNHAKAALMAGYTTYRDLGTEGLRDADANFRDAINRGLIEGPRMFVATECIASSGGYEIRQEHGMHCLGAASAPRISDPADGVDGVRAAVRRRLGAGADIIKFYADYRKRQLRFPPPAWPGAHEIAFPPSGDILTGTRNPNLLLFNQDEMNAMVSEAKAGKAPICAHAQSPEAVIMAAKAGVTSVEHGFMPSEEALDAMKENGTIFVPTLSVFDVSLHPSTGNTRDANETFRAILDHTKAAHEKGVKLACGGDTGAFAHGDNARELELFVEAGIPLEDVLQAATLHGWEACGGDLCGRRFGCIDAGFAADITALRGDVTEDLSALRRVAFVMKDGRICKDERKLRSIQWS
ncbi:amidohydrolase domain-containing protein [Biscogniauxia mediterranea]|nr:amidohydrolase domain-containing protein [Biscogniauxia mediterranea]